MAIKITGFDPDQYEKPEPESRSRPVRRTSSESSSAPAPQPREVRKSIDADTAEHLRIKYGLTNVKLTEVAPKKASGALKGYKSGATHRGTGPRLKSGPSEQPTVDDVAPAPAHPPGESGSDGGD
ncbi:MAG: hypothetical protein HY816_05705 [Candidatus Wallbacteria bacterium]|nr:hypothetical protein [Candidatus Wallbacteria bacterium]